MAAVYLHRAGWDLVGTSHYIYSGSSCCTEETLERARGICEFLDIPYYRIDLEDLFAEAVVGDFVDTYLDGETPNPCVRCNERVRFTVYVDRLSALLRTEGSLVGGDPLFFATGHYVRLEETSDGYLLRKGVDRTKDQSYMLYRIPRERLPLLRFPLGEHEKGDIQEEARALGLPSGSVRESQDACFTGGNYGEFLLEKSGGAAGFEEGDIVDTSGDLLGRHRGYVYYTPGQRKGLGLGNGPWYVVRIEPGENRVVVGRSDEGTSRTFPIRDCNWFLDPLPPSVDCTVQVRYNARDRECRVYPGDGREGFVELAEPFRITPGQSAVFYSGEYLLGGGIIRSFSP
jgi:tRNA-specific 2-thiouridylase